MEHKRPNRSISRHASNPLPRSSNQSGMRNYNERLVLSQIRRHGGLAKAQIARLTGLSAQTVTVIIRALEAEGLLVRGTPQRGRVGQPAVPISLNPDGVFSLGLFIGRRSAELVLMDFTGTVRNSKRITFAYPTPERILSFTLEGVAGLSDTLPDAHRERIVALGIGGPYELWNWAEEVGAPPGAMDGWREVDIEHEIGSKLSIPVYFENDATAACGAELIFGRGLELSDFIYFFIGLFVGGGVVSNGSIYHGHTGNAGAFGSMLIPGSDNEPKQLLDSASIVVLERMIDSAGLDSSTLWESRDDWSAIENVELVDKWIQVAAKNLAYAAAVACAVIDFEAIIIDGGFPETTRAALCDAVRRELEDLDLSGISSPNVIEGGTGSRARAIGAACLPLFERYMLDVNSQLGQSK